MPSPLSHSVYPPAATKRDSIRHHAEPILTVRHVPWRHDLSIITAAGEIDTDSVRLLQRALWQDLPAGLVLDLSRVTFFGSAGLRAVEGAVSRACAERRRIGIVSATRAVLRPLRIFGIDTHVGVYPILADALREVPLSPPPPVAIPGV
ncbi:STAS domain-containing protein [Amycolatopsis rifamycinica]|uniref:STAS domain-containing protein n=1 Tax=Amycolatopsis rifamycinica TaxID=287986 RepID=UPI00068A7EAA|nr:STAS domain-containing protein [Amycolatopsis rifamycinica]